MLRSFDALLKSVTEDVASFFTSLSDTTSVVLSLLRRNGVPGAVDVVTSAAESSGDAVTAASVDGRL